MVSPSTEIARRPRGVTVVVVLTYLSGILNIISGLVVVLVAANAQAQAALGASRGVILATGILSIVIGVVTLVVAGGLRHGRRVARLVVTVGMVLQILGGLFTVTGGHSQILSGLAQIVIAVAVIALLWTGEAKQFFEH